MQPHHAHKENRARKTTWANRRRYFILYTLNIPLYTHSTLVCAAIVVTSDLVTSGWMDLEFYNWELWLRVTSHCTFSGRRLEIFELWVILIAALVRVFSLSQLSDRMRLLLFHLQPCLRPRSSPVSFSFVFLWVFLCDLSQSAPSAVVACQFSLFKSRSVFFFLQPACLESCVWVLFCKTLMSWWCHLYVFCVVNTERPQKLHHVPLSCCSLNPWTFLKFFSVDNFEKCYWMLIIISLQ